MALGSHDHTPDERLAVVESEVLGLLADVKPMVATQPALKADVAWVKKLQWWNLGISMVTLVAVAGVKSGSIQAVLHLF